MSFFIILGLHILINVTNSIMSFYLAYSLSNFDGVKNNELASSLTLIIGLCLFTTILGKYVSSLIFISINKNLHAKVVKGLINTKM